MCLLDLVAAENSNIYNAEIVFGIVCIWGDLAPVLGDSTCVRQEISRGYSLPPKVRSRLSLCDSKNNGSNNE